MRKARSPEEIIEAIAGQLKRILDEQPELFSSDEGPTPALALNITGQPKRVEELARRLISCTDVLNTNAEDLPDAVALDALKQMAQDSSELLGRAFILQVTVGRAWGIISQSAAARAARG